MNIEYRERVLVNTDPMRRCYNGCHFSSEWRWSEWKVLEEGIPEEHIDERLEFWRSLNDFAVSERGESAKKEFRAV